MAGEVDDVVRELEGEPQRVPERGKGGTLALVGAYVLAGELGRADGEVATALARYDAVMRPFVAKAQELPPGSPAGFAPMGRIGVALGDLTYRTATTWPMRLIWAAQFAKADGIDLPAYT